MAQDMELYVLKCQKCNFSTNDPSEYEHHQTKHPKTEYMCKNCGDTFKHQQSYNRHLKDFPQNHRFPCENCGKIFKRLKFLKSHYCTRKNVDSDTINENIPFEELFFADNALVESKDAVKENKDSDLVPQTIEEAALNSLFSSHQKYNVYKCYECEWIFTTDESYKRHVALYKEPHFSYPCCNAPLKRSDDILKHVCNTSKIETKNYITVEPTSLSEAENEEDFDLVSDDNKPYKCQNCPAAYFRLESLKLHIKKFPGKHDFKCCKCLKHYLLERSLKKHLCLFENSSSFQCSCLNYFKDIKSFKKHISTQRPYLCCSCQAKCETFYNLINHIRTHTKEKPFVCDYCGKHFSVKESLKLHIKTHFGLKPHKCSFCEYTTSTKWNLKSHERQHLPDEQKQRCYLCTECGAAFYLKHHLRRHSKTHTNEKNNLCGICGKLFRQNSYLKTHMLKHKFGESCSKCHKSLEKDQLFDHHLETKHFDFVCVPCQKVFQNKFNLERHLKTHVKMTASESLSFECELCNRVFNKRQNLSKHYEKHLTSKLEKFKCNYCDRVFCRQSNLNQHLKCHEKL